MTDDGAHRTPLQPNEPAAGRELWLARVLLTELWKVGRPANDSILLQPPMIGKALRLDPKNPKALALAGLDLLTHPDLLAAAQAEFKRKINGKAYISPIPEGTVPH